MINLRGKRALVTGAGRRLGAEVAVALGTRQMEVAVHYGSSAEGAQATCERVRAAGGSAFPVAGDLREAGQARGVVDAAQAALGGLDLLVLSAASFERTPFPSVSEHDLEAAFELNVTAPFVMAQRAAPALATSHGSIVLITCVSRLVPYRHYLAYETSKAALHQLMRLLALELAPDVRVNAVAPGSVLPPDDWPEARKAQLAARVPLGTLGRGADVVEAVLHLAGSEWLTGTEIVVDGGRSVMG